MYLDACMHVYAYEHMYTQILAYFVSLVTLHFVLRNKVPHWTQSSSILLEWLDSKLQGSICHHFPGAAMIYAPGQVQVIMLIWKISTDQALFAML